MNLINSEILTCVHKRRKKGGGPCTRLKKRVAKFEESEAKPKGKVTQRKKVNNATGLKVSKTKDEEAEYECDSDGCTMSFGSKQELTVHKRNICPVKGRGKKFFSHKYLVQHRRVHEDDRPLSCPWKGCKMTFKWAWARTEHIRVHTGARPYACAEPGRGPGKHSDLFLISVTTSERPVIQQRRVINSEWSRCSLAQFMNSSPNCSIDTVGNNRLRIRISLQLPFVIILLVVFSLWVFCTLLFILSRACLDYVNMILNQARIPCKCKPHVCVLRNFMQQPCMMHVSIRLFSEMLVLSIPRNAHSFFLFSSLFWVPLND